MSGGERRSDLAQGSAAVDHAPDGCSQSVQLQPPDPRRIGRSAEPARDPGRPGGADAGYCSSSSPLARRDSRTCRFRTGVQPSASSRRTSVGRRLDGNHPIGRNHLLPEPGIDAAPILHAYAEDPVARRDMPQAGAADRPPAHARGSVRQPPQGLPAAVASVRRRRKVRRESGSQAHGHHSGPKHAGQTHAAGKTGQQHRRVLPPHAP
jgi:hypothetical protein